MNGGGGTKYVIGYLLMCFIAFGKGILRTHHFSQTLSQNHLTVHPISAFSQTCDGASARRRRDRTRTAKADSIFCL
ncbi:hypothetical protein [Nostoc sp. UIC 10630]|uniref:hypothetical protein n=1 Tax=Nostoc sp. UIC 10630 TaxID=2100146 RepID=UPI0013D11169|nr:hypothetical protein [Nostoc sp. UIC 10630]NEU78551.1 hypothetical protein [Nostoc sp. UIC 10630]